MKKFLITAVLLLILLAGGWWLIESVPEGAGWPILLAFVVVEVIFAPIPGGAVTYIAAEQLGYWAWPVQYAGNIIGATIVFFLVRRFGQPYIRRVASEKELDRYDRLLRNHPRLLWGVYAVPIFPIDLVTIVSALSGIRAKKFFLIISTALVAYTGLQTLIAVKLAQYVGILHILSAVAAAIIVVLIVMGIVRLRKNALDRRAKRT